MTASNRTARITAILSTIVAVMLPLKASHADVFELVNGGRIQGEWIDRDGAGVYVVKAATGQLKLANAFPRSNCRDT